MNARQRGGTCLPTRELPVSETNSYPSRPKLDYSSQESGRPSKWTVRGRDMHMVRVPKSAPMPRAAFDEALYAWSATAKPGETVGDTTRRGQTPWLHIAHAGGLFYLNADSTKDGVDKYLGVLREEPRAEWTVVANNRGVLNKAAFGTSQRIIKKFYMYRADSGVGNRSSLSSMRSDTPPVRQGSDEQARNVHAEFEHRQSMWDRLVAEGGPERVAPRLLRDLGIYGGAQGVWVDKGRTAGLIPGSPGLAVGLLHTGRSYSDDLDDDGILYHYPTTDRTGSRDENEVQSIRDAGSAGLPMFVITQPTYSSRSATRAWLLDDNPSNRTFYLAFHRDSPRIQTARELDSMRFDLDDPDPDVRKDRRVLARKGQGRFRYEVLARYGATCAFCGIAHEGLLDAAHLKARAKGGSNDPRNGLPLCKNHHRALDDGIVGVDPETMIITGKGASENLQSLHVERSDLSHLPSAPDRTALKWIWEHQFSGDEN